MVLIKREFGLNVKLDIGDHHNYGSATKWVDKTGGIKVGDKVCYKASFLRSIGQFTGDLPHARGTVTEVKPFGENALAVVDWRDPGIPSKILLSNLSRITDRGIAD